MSKADLPVHFGFRRESAECGRSGPAVSCWQRVTCPDCLGGYIEYLEEVIRKTKDALSDYSVASSAPRDPAHEGDHGGGGRR